MPTVRFFVLQLDEGYLGELMWPLELNDDSDEPTLRQTGSMMITVDSAPKEINLEVYPLSDWELDDTISKLEDDDVFSSEPLPTVFIWQIDVHAFPGNDNKDWLEKKLSEWAKIIGPPALRVVFLTGFDYVEADDLPSLELPEGFVLLKTEVLGPTIENLFGDLIIKALEIGPFDMIPILQNFASYKETARVLYLRRVQEYMRTVGGEPTENQLLEVLAMLVSPSSMPRALPAGQAATASTSGMKPEKLSDKSILEEIRKDFPNFRCPISHEVMQEPVILISSQKTYDRANLEKWLVDNKTDPLTRIETDGKFILNEALCQTIQHVYDEHVKKSARAEAPSSAPSASP